MNGSKVILATWIAVALLATLVVAERAATPRSTPSDDSPISPLASHVVAAPRTAISNNTATSLLELADVVENPLSNFAFAIEPPTAISGTCTVAGSFAPGGTVTYFIVLTNNATFDQRDNPGHEFINILPTGLALQSVTSTSGTAVAYVATNTVTWDGSIKSHESVKLTITAMVLTGSDGTVVSNQGTISYQLNGDDSNSQTTVTDDPTLPGVADPTTFTVPLPLPKFLSAPTANPSPAVVDLTVVFGAVTQPSNATLSWNFGDGTESSDGNGAQHIYTVEGTYHVVVTATDPKFGTSSPYSFQVVVGHSSLLPDTLAPLSGQGSLTFGKHQDSLTVTTVLPCPKKCLVSSAALNELPAVVSIGGLSQTFSLNSHGSGSTLTGQIRVRVQSGKNSNKINLTVSFSGALKNVLNSNLALDNNGLPLRIPFVVQIGGKTYSAVSVLKFKRTHAASTARFSFPTE